MPEKPLLSEVHGFVGQDLQRPECVIWHPSELLIIPNWYGNGGVSLISGDQRTHHLLSNGPEPLRPNGIALENGGTVLLAHMGETRGSIYRLFADGNTEPVVTTVNSEPMPPANFVVVDSDNRLWITVSTRKTPRASDYRANANSGFIAVAEPGATDAHIVADNLGYTNECVIDEARGYVYVNETFGRRLTRFDLSRGNPAVLSKPTVIAHFGDGTYPDGLTLDSEGCLWVTSIVSNRIIRVYPDGKQEVFFEDSVDAHLQNVEKAYESDSLGREHLDNAQSRQMKNISNAAFGGPSGQRLFLGNLLGTTIPFLDVEATGAPMVHWEASLGALQQFV